MQLDKVKQNIKHFTINTVYVSFVVTLNIIADYNGKDDNSMLA